MAGDVAVRAFFAGRPTAQRCYDAVEAALTDLGPFEVRVSASQVAFRRRRGFAWLWLPGRWLAHPRTECVLSFALPEPVDSPRLAEVVHPTPRAWMHHLDLAGPDVIDDEVRGWLARAHAAAG